MDYEQKSQSPIFKACTEGDLQLVKQWLQEDEQNVQFLPTMNHIISLKNLDMLQLVYPLLKNYEHVGQHKYYVDNAARTNDVDIVKFLLQQGLTPTDHTVGKCFISGNYDTGEYLASLGYTIYSQRMVEWACDGLLKPILNLTKYGVKYSQKVMAVAAANGHLDIVEYLFLHDICEKPSKTVIESAAKYGHEKIVKWCISHEFPCSEWAMKHCLDNIEKENYQACFTLLVEAKCQVLSRDLNRYERTKARFNL